MGTTTYIGVDLNALRPVFVHYDGLFPDINFSFCGARAVGSAYALLQGRATGLSLVGACYWSKKRRTLCPIEFGDNPTDQIASGDCDTFRVAFTGLRSASGIPIPDLGVFVLGDDHLSLEYSMGSQWSESAIAGLLELMNEIASLSAHTVVTHERNLRDPHGEILLSAFNKWRMGCKNHG